MYPLIIYITREGLGGLWPPSFLLLWRAGGALQALLGTFGPILSSSRDDMGPYVAVMGCYETLWGQVWDVMGPYGAVMGCYGILLVGMG